MRLLALGVLCSALLVGIAHAAAANDRDRARALVIAPADVPAYWDATISADPCPSRAVPAARGATRVASRWGGTTAGVWSVALVASRPSQADAVFREISSSLPGCVARFWKAHAFPPAVEHIEVRVVSRPLVPLEAENRRWTISVVDGRANTPDPSFEVVVVRRGRAVAQYVYGAWDALPAIRAALARS